MITVITHDSRFAEIRGQLGDGGDQNIRSERRSRSKRDRITTTS
jgi:hypothetical protein